MSNARSIPAILDAVDAGCGLDSTDAAALVAAFRQAVVQVGRLERNAEAREAVLRREGDLLRQAQRERDEALARVFSFACSDHGGEPSRPLYCATCGRPMSWSGPRAPTYADLAAEVERLRAALDRPAMREARCEELLARFDDSARKIAAACDEIDALLEDR